jgi:hypothetical protein
MTVVFLNYTTKLRFKKNIIKKNGGGKKGTAFYKSVENMALNKIIN